MAVEYPETHAVTLLRKVVQRIQSTETENPDITTASERLIEMWERLAAQTEQAANNAGKCPRCETIASLFEPPPREITADEVIDFILDLKRTIAGGPFAAVLPPATDKDSGVR